jgi:competence transcription factor ComK
MINLIKDDIFNDNKPKITTFVKIKDTDYKIHKLKINEQHIKSLEEIEDKMCAICFENQITLQTDCNHNYCTNCITEHYKINNSCPYCRSKIQECYQIV